MRSLTKQNWLILLYCFIVNVHNIQTFKSIIDHINEHCIVLRPIQKDFISKKIYD